MDYESLLRRRRVKLGLSLRDVADMTGLSHPSLSRLERGQQNFSIDSIVKIAEVYGVDVKILIELQSERNKQLKKQEVSQ